MLCGNDPVKVGIGKQKELFALIKKKSRTGVESWCGVGGRKKV